MRKGSYRYERDFPLLRSFLDSGLNISSFAKQENLPLSKTKLMISLEMEQIKRSEIIPIELRLWIDDLTFSGLIKHKKVWLLVLGYYNRQVFAVESYSKTYRIVLNIKGESFDIAGFPHLPRVGDYINAYQILGGMINKPYEKDKTVIVSKVTWREDNWGVFTELEVNYLI